MKNSNKNKDSKIKSSPRVNVTLFYNDEDPELTPERWWARRQSQNLDLTCM